MAVVDISSKLELSQVQRIGLAFECFVVFIKLLHQDGSGFIIPATKPIMTKTMQPVIATTITALFNACLTCEVNKNQLKQKAISIVKKFGGTLKPALGKVL